MSKKQKNYYLRLTTVAGINEYAGKNKIPDSAVIEMLWEKFNGSNTEIVEQNAERFYCYFRKRLFEDIKKTIEHGGD